MIKAFTKRLKVVSAGLVAAAMLLLNITPVYAGYYTDSDSDHESVNFSEIRKADIYDYDTVDASIKALQEAVKKKNNDAEVRKCYKTMLAEIDNLVTANALLNLEFYTHLDDESLVERMEKLSAELVDLGDRATKAISLMVESSYRYIVEEDIGDSAAEYEGYEEMSEEEKDLLAKEDSLVTEYERTSQDESYSGTSRYNMLANNYIELIKVRKNIAKFSEYDTYRAYSYASVYGRDYTSEEADQYHEYVKKYVVPLYDDVVDLILEDVNSYYDLWDLTYKNLNNIFKIMDLHLKEINPELTVSYKYFKDNQVYYIENDETMYEAGYTTKLYTYNTPFIYNALYGNFYDYTSVFHEFGHFNNMYHDNSCAMYSQTSYDVAEIHSQGLELFFLKWADECYGAKLADMARLFTMYRMLDSIVQGSLQDEFQAKAFELSDSELTASNLKKLYRNLMAEYGITGMDDTGWVEISHTFSSPFYYISYSTSAMSALQLYDMSNSDWDKATDIYMKLSALPGSMGYCEAVESVGLANIMDKGIVEEVCKGLEKVLLGSGNDDPGKEDPGNDNPNAGGEDEPSGTDDKKPTSKPAKTDKSDASEDENNSGADMYTIIRTVAICVAIGGVCVIIISVVVLKVTGKKKNGKESNGNQ